MLVCSQFSIVDVLACLSQIARGFPTSVVGALRNVTRSRRLGRCRIRNCGRIETFSFRLSYVIATRSLSTLVGDNSTSRRNRVVCAKSRHCTLCFCFVQGDSQKLSNAPSTFDTFVQRSSGTGQRLHCNIGLEESAPKILVFNHLMSCKMREHTEGP